ncbi:MAG: hypothetical protein AAGH15_01190 [Myxococcota bacterium]
MEALVPLQLVRSVGLAVLALGLVTSDARADASPWRLAAEGHFSALSDQTDRSLLNVSYGGALRVAYRRSGPASRIGAVLVLERNAWFGTELDAGPFPGVWNVGGGVERVWAEGRIRSALVGGASILDGDTPLHQRGTTGLFFDIRPVALRWPVHPHVALELTPLGLSLLLPALRYPRLLLTQYRTTFAIEVRLP